MELNDRVYNKVIELTKLGNKQFDEGKFELAIDYYSQALSLVPLPRYDWEASTWLYTAMGDAYFYSQKYDEAIDCLNKALLCPEGLGNPFICLRIGECFYEINNYDKAQEYFIKAYMMKEMEIFENEEEKYKEELCKILGRK